MARQAAPLEVRAGPFAAMVEEADVVVLAFERLDFAFDEPVQFDKVRGNFGGYFEIQRRRSCSNFTAARRRSRSHQPDARASPRLRKPGAV